MKGQAKYTITHFSLDHDNNRTIVVQPTWVKKTYEKQVTPYSLEYDPRGILSLFFFTRPHDQKKEYEKELFRCILLTKDKQLCVSIDPNHHRRAFWPISNKTGKMGPQTDSLFEELNPANSIPGILKQALEGKQKRYTPEARHNNNEELRVEKLQKHAPIGSLATSAAVLAAGFATGFCLPEYTNLIAGVTVAAIAIIIIVTVGVSLTQKKHRELTPKRRQKLIASMHPVHRINLDKIKEEAAELLRTNGIE